MRQGSMKDRHQKINAPIPGYAHGLTGGP